MSFATPESGVPWEGPGTDEMTEFIQGRNAQGLRTWTPGFDTLDDNAVFTAATESGFWGGAPYAVYVERNGLVEAWFRMVLLPTDPATVVDLGTGWFALTPPVAPLVEAADYGAGAIISVDDGTTPNNWPVQFILDPVYDEERFLLGRTDQQSVIGATDQTASPPPTFVGGEGPGEWSDADALTSTAPFVILRGRLSYPTLAG